MMRDFLSHIKTIVCNLRVYSVPLEENVDAISLEIYHLSVHHSFLLLKASSLLLLLLKWTLFLLMNLVPPDLIRNPSFLLLTTLKDMYHLPRVILDLILIVVMLMLVEAKATPSVGVVVVVLLEVMVNTLQIFHAKSV